ncbi:MAG: glycoside hydrolase family 92 protein [Chitinophagaceae bacterium]
MKFFPTLFLAVYFVNAAAQSPVKTEPSALVNVFVGSEGDRGQMSPAASYPFGMLSVGPQTYPNLHMGYDHRATQFVGFTHNRFEGVGCKGSGGNILIKPFIGDNYSEDKLLKKKETAGAGFYSVAFFNGIKADIAVVKNAGVEEYSFPAGKKGFYIDLSHTLANSFVAEEHSINKNDNSVTGWVDARTTCNVGIYRVYYTLNFSQPVNMIETAPHQLVATVAGNASTVRVKIALSSVDTEHAIAAINNASFPEMKTAATKAWNDVLSAIKVSGDVEQQKLFYSMLYRTVQSPYMISEPDGKFRATDGSLQQSKNERYNGWAIWDNYRTQLPLLSILYPKRYSDITTSIAGLYTYGKKDYATLHEPSNTVRTEHGMVVLLDAIRKGYAVDLAVITDSLIGEAERLDFSKPDKALESSYDLWALSQLLSLAGKTELSKTYLQKAAAYKDYWTKDFKDITKPDVDRVSARGLYQGTIWQYRWFVPFDIKGLIDLAGGEANYLKELDYFFDNDLYNHSNEPDIQVPLMYNMTSQPWKSQLMMRRYAADTVVQYYFNDNSRGIDPFIGVIYTNKPDTYVRTMDDDAGAMSAWYVFAAAGFSPACVGWPVYYLNVPLFSEVQLNPQGSKSFVIRVKNAGTQNRYIKSAILNGKTLDRNWLTHEEIMKGGELIIEASATPNKSWGVTNQWITEIGK